LAPPTRKPQDGNPRGEIMAQETHPNVALSPAGKREKDPHADGDG